MITYPKLGCCSGKYGSGQVFNYDLYCRMWACLLCVFVPPHTSLIKDGNSGFFIGLYHYLYIFIPRLVFGIHVGSDLNQNG